MRGHTDIRSHLEDLANRHPEFADQLRYPAWSTENRSNTWGRKRQRDTGEASQQEPQQTETESPVRERPKENLRNTVPVMGQKQQQQETEDKESRGKRSWSAPPDNRSQTPDKPRFVSKIEIQPVNPDAASHSETADATKPPMAPPKPQPQQQQPQQQPQTKQSNVRHIPIFVEGRDEPILPKNVEPEFTQSHAPPPQQFSRAHAQPTQHHFQPDPPPQPQKSNQGHPPPPQQKEPPPVNPRDPLFRVENVQREVDGLKDRVEQFTGNSRTDKEYILLDELLTRNLIKLDDIETEGKEEVRTARKNTIKSIQRCISVLENKAPLPGGENKEALVDQQVVANSDESAAPVSPSVEKGAMDQSQPLEETAEKKPDQQQHEEVLMETETLEESNPPIEEEVKDVEGENPKDSSSKETPVNKTA